MNVIMSIVDQVVPEQRASRDFRAKYPDDVLLDQISGEYNCMSCTQTCDMRMASVYIRTDFLVEV
jgi:hypothetical protein